MYVVKRPFNRLVVLIILALLLVACGTETGNSNWPGMSANGDTVYVAYGEGVLAYDVANQEQAWLFPEERSQAPIFAAPSIQDNRVAIGDFGAPSGFFNPSSLVTLYLLEDNGTTFQEIWQANLTNASIVAPPLQVDNLVIVGTTDKSVVAYDSDDAGQEVWRFEMEAGVWGQPAHENGVIFVASLDKTVYAIDITSGTQIWRSEPLVGALVSQPTISDGVIYVSSFDGKVHGLSAESGEWSWEFTTEDWVWASPTLADGILYFADQSGRVYAISAQGGEEIWRQQFDQTFQTSPVVVEDKLFVASAGDLTLALRDREEGALIALNLADGEELWRKRTSAPIYTTPVVASDSIVVVIEGENEFLIGFDARTGNRQWDIGLPER